MKYFGIGHFLRIAIVFLVIALIPRASFSEFYKYVDKHGIVHFVDRKTKIPREYRKALEIYDEKYDHLPPEEKEKRLEADRKKAAAFKQKRREQLEALKRQEKIAEEKRLREEQEKQAAERRLQEAASRKEFLENVETKVLIQGMHALVPCTLGYKNREVETYLLLDTGCTVTTVHDEVADQLRVKGGRKIKSRIAGGGILESKLAKLSYIKVGPYRVDDFYISIIKHKGKKTADSGLLGMNFLAGRDYKIDYVQRVIRWTP